MEVIEYFTSENKRHWKNQIAKSDWSAGQYLAMLLEEDNLKNLLGETALVFMLTDGEKLLSFCTFAPLDEIQPTELFPWIGFVYTFPEYRKNGFAGKLLDYVECFATIMGRDAIYVSTDNCCFYEKYGYEFFQTAKNVSGEECRIYKKNLSLDDDKKDRRMKLGDKYKSKVVGDAKKNMDPIACCGFSCDHCFLGQWCGGCRSVFNCCSFGTLFEKGRCPNKVCSKDKGLDGCYECDGLEECGIGFYKKGNDGANACKAQSIFIKLHGKEKLLQVQDELHKKFDFKKTQEILGEDMDKGLRILEEVLVSLNKGF